MSLHIKIPKTVEITVATSEGIKILMGEVEPALTRMEITVVGKI